MIDTVAVPYVLYRNRSKIHAQSTRLHTYSFSRHQKGHTGKFFLKNKRRPQSPTLHCALRSGLHSFDCSMFVFFQALWLVFTCVILENQHNNFYLFCLLLLTLWCRLILTFLEKQWLSTIVLGALGYPTQQAIVNLLVSTMQTMD